METIQMPLSQKQETFLRFLFFFAFLKSILHFKHLPEKDDPHIGVEKKTCFGGPLDKQHGKWVNTLLQSE